MTGWNSVEWCCGLDTFKAFFKGEVLLLQNIFGLLWKGFWNKRQINKLVNGCLSLIVLQSPNLDLGLTLEWRSSLTSSADTAVRKFFRAYLKPVLGTGCCLNEVHKAWNSPQIDQPIAGKRFQSTCVYSWEGKTPAKEIHIHWNTQTLPLGSVGATSGLLLRSLTT